MRSRAGKQGIRLSAMLWGSLKACVEICSARRMNNDLVARIALHCRLKSKDYQIIKINVFFASMFPTNYTPHTNTLRIFEM